ncbi:beta-2 adrenergic receptor-like [Amphiura filiformis]|uniref:beta-2 adrenergic receptor-like n=1 Tax=Amphiura filiformis TaxID=82378 RepID=UPI003B2216B4
MGFNFSSNHQQPNISVSTPEPTTSGHDEEDILSVGVIGSLIFTLILAVIIFFGNGLVILLVVRFERLRTVTNYLMMSLAAADAIVSVSMVFGVVFILTPKSFENKYTCLGMWNTFMFAGFTSCLSLLLVTFERYLKISRPFSYQHIATTRVTFIAIAVIWIYTILLTIVLPLAGNNIVQSGSEFDCLDFNQVFHSAYLQFLLYANAILPFTIMCFIYCKLFLLVLEKLRSSTATADVSSKHWLKIEFKSVKTLLILLGFTGLAWLPISFMVLTDIYLGDSWTPSVELRSLFCMLLYINSTANPIIYSLRSEQFRTASIKLFCGDHRYRRWQPPVIPLSTIGGGTSKSPITAMSTV